MKLSNYFVGFFFLFALALFAGEAWAKKGPIQDHPYFKDLNLTPDQKQKLELIQKRDKEMRAELKKVQAEVAAAKGELEAALKSSASNKDVLIKYDDFTALQTKFARGRFERILEMRLILTPEQRAKFQSNIEDRRGRKAKHQKEAARKFKAEEDGEDYVEP